MHVDNNDDRSCFSSDRTGSRTSGFDTIAEPLSVVLPLWSILAGRLLRALTAARGTERKWTGPPLACLNRGHCRHGFRWLAVDEGSPCPALICHLAVLIR